MRHGAPSLETSWAHGTNQRPLAQSTAESSPVPSPSVSTCATLSRNQAAGNYSSMRQQKACARLGARPPTLNRGAACHRDQRGASCSTSCAGVEAAVQMDMADNLGRVEETCQPPNCSRGPCQLRRHVEIGILCATQCVRERWIQRRRQAGLQLTVYYTFHLRTDTCRRQYKGRPKNSAPRRQSWGQKAGCRDGTRWLLHCKLDQQFAKTRAKLQSRGNLDLVDRTSPARSLLSLSIHDSRSSPSRWAKHTESEPIAHVQLACSYSASASPPT
jgi:hypothetical protein